MALIDFNRNPSASQLRQFGVVCAVALPLLTWVWTRNVEWTASAGSIGLALCVIGVACPRLLKPVFLGLTIVTLPVGFVVGELAMLAIYLGLFLPMAIVFRLTGRDTLNRKQTDDRKTFWTVKTAPTEVRKYYRQS